MDFALSETKDFVSAGFGSSAIGFIATDFSLPEIGGFVSAGFDSAVF